MLSRSFRDQQSNIRVTKLGPNLSPITETDWKLLSLSKMADRSEEGEQNGVNTWVNTQWNSFFTNLEELLSEYVQKKQTNDIVLRESLHVRLENAVQALQN